MATEIIRTGGCLCGAVRYTVKGEPYKSGLCHCTDRRQVTGSGQTISSAELNFLSTYAMRLGSANTLGEIR
jgi:hypothetical protein